jgi:hypothetical protein
MIEDVSSKAVHFWGTSIALMQAEAQEKTLDKLQRAKLDESLAIHTLVRQGLGDGGLRHCLMSFQKA